jgi:hypothetical protein
VIVPELRRSPAGKADLSWAQRIARDQAAAGTAGTL